MNCPKCNDCQVDTMNEKATGKKAGIANLCKNCRYGLNGHKKMAKPKT